jgi:photosystem II stability/assembly factor-like uncharacterized protein
MTNTFFKYIKLTLFMLLQTNVIFAQWQTLYKDSAHFQFNTVHFLNNDTGFVGGYDFTNNTNGVIFRTFDGGQTWDTTQLYELIICIHYLNNSFGFCGGDGGADYLTTDLGDTWQQRGFSSTMSDHSSIFFTSPSLGFRSTMQSWIQITTDTGNTWQNVFNSSGGSYFPGTSKMVFPDAQVGYLAQSRFGQVKSITKTSDGGITWNDLPIPSNLFPYSCYFFNTTSGIAVGRYGGVSRTSDGGQTWTNPDSISNYTLYDVAFVNDSVGYIVGGFTQYDSSSIRKGVIFKTIDSGINWSLIDSSYFDGLTKIHFPSDSVGYAVGYNGIILKISNANSVNTSIHEYADTDKFNVYPNPAKTGIVISTIKSDDLEIFDMTGKMILYAKIKPGMISCELNISHISPGIYFVRNGIEVIKFIKE